jgi:hypothetical protein
VRGRLLLVLALLGGGPQTALAATTPPSTVLLLAQRFSLEHGVLPSVKGWLPYWLALMALLGAGLYWRRSTRSKA